MFLERLGTVIGYGVVKEMERTGEIESIMRRQMARTWNEMADDPANAKISGKLRKMATAALDGGKR